MCGQYGDDRGIQGVGDCKEVGRWVKLVGGEMAVSGVNIKVIDNVWVGGKGLPVVGIYIF